jgi:hypothetical protein
MVFIEPVIRSTCFGHYYAHHQELETIQMVPAYGISPTAMHHLTYVMAGCWPGAWP